MALGGFNGTDPAPTLAEFREIVRSGQIHYYAAAGRMMQGDTGSDDAHEIAEWVTQNYTATTVSGTTLYRLDGS